MKLIIQIPCYNEEETLPVTLSNLPRRLEGIEKIEWLVIDDGSTDQTSDIARRHGVDHIISHPKNFGLGRTFMTGLASCIERGADVIVNTDGDNQYDAGCISDLIRPILSKTADIVIGVRPIDDIEHFSFIKKLLQKLGSWTVRLASNTKIPDTTSGFRAFTKEAAQKLNVFSNYTYTLETIIQAGQKNIAINWVPIRTNDCLRPSRLIKSIPSYIFKSISTIVRIFVVYRPFRFFMLIGTGLFSIGFLIGFRFLWYYLTGEGSGHVQSLILSSIFIGIGFQTVLIAFIADLLSVNRRLLEELQYKSRDKKPDKYQ